MSRKRSVFRSPFLWFLVLCAILIISGLASGEVVFHDPFARFALGFILAVVVIVGAGLAEGLTRFEGAERVIRVIAFVIIIAGIFLQWTWLIGPEKTVLTNRHTWESRRAEGPQLINPFTTRVTDFSYVYLTHEATGISGSYILDTARLVETHKRFGSQDSLAAFIKAEYKRQVDSFVARCGSTNTYCILCQFTADSLDFPNGRVKKLYIVP